MKNQNTELEDKIQEDFKIIEDYQKTVEMPLIAFNPTFNVVGCKEENLQPTLEAVLAGINSSIGDFFKFPICGMNLQINLFLGDTGVLAYQNQFNLTGEESESIN